MGAHLYFLASTPHFINMSSPPCRRPAIYTAHTNFNKSYLHDSYHKPPNQVLRNAKLHIKTQKGRLHAHHCSHVLIKLRYINKSKRLLNEHDVTKSNKCSMKCVQLFCLDQRRKETSVQCYTMWQNRNNSWTVCSGCRRQDDRRHVRLQVHRGVGADQRQGGRPARRHHQSDPSPSTQLSPTLESTGRRRRPPVAHQTHRTALWAPVVRVTFLRQPARALTNGL